MPSAMWGRPTSGCASGMWNTGTIVVCCSFFSPLSCTQPCTFTERLAELEQCCVGGEPIIDTCICGVHHREYLVSKIGTFTDFNALMTQAIISMGKQPNPVFYNPPSPHDIYDLIHLS
jgi:hypothetical protein